MTSAAVYPSSSTAVPPRLARVLYRSLLRSSQYGKRPEVFGQYGANVFAAQVAAHKEHASLALPDEPSLVRKRLKAWFQNPLTNSESSSSSCGLEAMRHAMEQQTMLPLHNCRREPSSLSATMSAAHPTPHEEAILPIFDYNGVAALPGETIQFVFLEPRYLNLANQVRQTPSKQFLLRSCPKSPSATLLKLVSHIRLPGDMMAVACLGGPRIKVLQETIQHVPGELDPAVAEHYKVDLERSTQLSLATRYKWHTDKEDDKSVKSLEWMTRTRPYILDMFHYLLPLQDSDLVDTLQTFGLPPIDPEAFSFWALRYVVAIDDIQVRLQWSHECRNTVERLEFVVSEMEAIYDVQVGKVAAVYA